MSGKLIDYCAPNDSSCYGYGVTHPLTVTGGDARDLPHNTQLDRGLRGLQRLAGR